MYGLIYKITNKINNKLYIGLTTMTIKERWSCHKAESRAGNNTILYNSMRKYGEDNFTIEQIDQANSQIELEEKEIYYIDYYKSISPKGYNLTYGGIVSTKQSKETCIKKSKSQKEAYCLDLSLKEKRIKGLRNFWQTATDEQLKDRSDKIKQAWTTGRREKMSNMNKGHKRAYGNTYRRFAIKVINELTGEQLIFDSCELACKELNLSGSAVSRCLKGERKRHKGYRFLSV